MALDAVRTVLRNAAVLDPGAGSLAEGQAVVVEDDRVVEVGPAGAVRAGEAAALDVRGMTVMPGLIDAHVHVYAATADLAAIEGWAPSYLTARAAGILRGMLDRGFTTVRDVAGADFGIAAAVAEGLLAGPRVIFGGRALSQTGGHGDARGPGRVVLDQHPCAPALSVVADGVTEVRRAAREQLRRGAHHVKVMLSGGVASPTDRIDSTQYSMEELRAVVEVLDAGLGALELAHRAGLPIVYGTDLLGGMHRRQLTELTLRSEVQPPADILRSATTVAARLVGLEGRAGVVAPGAFADLLVVDGNPLERLEVLTDPARHLRLVMAAGRIHTNSLA